jgi:tetratricopeptide (TPR) repeat protein
MVSGRERTMRAGVLCGVLVAALGPRAASAAGELIADIQISRRAEETTVAIVLECPVRVRSDAATAGGSSVEIRVTPVEDCAGLRGGALASEAYRPASGHLAHLMEVQYESLGLGDDLLLLHFDRPVAYRVGQRADLRTIEVRLREAGAVGRAPAAPDVAAAGAPETPMPPPEVPVERAPLTARVRAPLVAADYVLNLQSTREPVDSAALAAVSVSAEQRLYVSTAVIAGVTWYRLRLGFFASEADARAALDALASAFPRAWIGRAEPSEVEAAAQPELVRGAVVAGREGGEAVDAAAPAPASGTLAPQRLAELRAEARAAIVAGQLDVAIRDYTRLLEEPGEHAAEARENLGVAREKNGQAAHAAAEYRRFLADFPDDEGAPRVRQRLAGLIAASTAPREKLRSADSGGGVDFTTNVSQYFRRDENRFDRDESAITTLSALFTDLDLSVAAGGTTVDWRGRLTLNHLHDLHDGRDGGPGDRKRVAYAYLDVSGVQEEWSMRLGRQTMRNSGVLGRFDGLHAAYGWAPDRRVRVMTGFPVELTRRSVDTSREFIGAAVDFDNLIGEWTLSPFVTRQTIDGTLDRQAVGLDVRFFDDRRSFSGMLDYDVDYGELNTALLFGTWRLGRLILTGLFDQRMSPILTTRNALIGQPAETIDELLLVWTEDEIRQIARERTAEARTVTLGVAAPIAERWQANADVTITEIGDSVESAGVPALQSTGRQTYYSASFVGSALFATSDVSVFNVRIGRSDSFSATDIAWDLRVPVGRKLRINPRLRVGLWESNATGRRRETLAPSLRLLFNTSGHYRLELEAGTASVVRTDRGDEQEATGWFFNVGYRADFQP